MVEEDVYNQDNLTFAQDHPQEQVKLGQDEDNWNHEANLLRSRPRAPCTTTPLVVEVG